MPRRGLNPGEPHGSPDELDRVAGLFGGGSSPFSDAPAVSSLPEQNLDHDRYDARLWRELLEASSSLSDLNGDGDAPETFPALLEDLFLSYFKAQPDLLPEHAIRPAHRRANRPFVERTLDDPDTYRARATTRLDVAASGLSALAAGERLLEEIKTRPPLEEFFDEAADEHTEDRPEGGEDESPTETGPGGEGADGPDHETPEPAADDGDPSDPDGPPLPNKDARRAVRSAAKAGAEQADTVARALSGWGLSPADLARVPLGERLDLLAALSAREMTRLSELVGRMRALARHDARDRVRERRDEIHSIEPSGDLPRLLPTELAALASDEPLRRLEAESRLLEGQALSWELRTEKDKNKGPLVAMIDCSGSMAGPNMEWASAVALGLVDLAAGRSGLPKRPAALVYFNARVVQELRFAAGERDPRKLLAAATVAAAGGTYYEPPLARALEILAEEGVYREADLLLVTDALCRLDDRFAQKLLDHKERTGTRVYSVLIGARDQGGELSRYCDKVFPLQDLAAAGPEVAGEVFGMFA